MDEKKQFKKIDDLIKCIDTGIIDNDNCILSLNGNELDIFDLIKRYNLKVNEFIHYNDGGYYLYNYKSFKEIKNNQLNTFAVGPPSMYGNQIAKLNINNLQIEISKSPKSDYQLKFSSHIVDKIRSNNYLVLDIETTGLDPFTDDIIQLCIYESETNKYVRYLPLENKQKNTAIEINHISKTLLNNKEPLSQIEVDKLIKDLNIVNKTIVIWTGKNLFDRLFLEIYFKKHNLQGLEFFYFFNAKTLLDDIANTLPIKDYSKDNIARIYGIDINNNHDALKDCIIEKRIVDNLLQNNIKPLQEEREEIIVNKIKEFLIRVSHMSSIEEISMWYEDTAQSLYIEYCEFLIQKYGKVSRNYDQHHITRGKEWIDIHHYDEVCVDNIAVKTNDAILSSNIKSLKYLHKYNKKDRLVYANKVEHFLLHCIIDIIRGIGSSGPNFTFGELLKEEIGIFTAGTKEQLIQTNKNIYYKYISFDDIIQIYAKHEKLVGCNMVNDLIEFWKINYRFDSNRYDIIIQNIVSIMK